jgi:aminopeptidase N
MLKWLGLQAMGAEGTRVCTALAASPTFNIKNPNSCYNLFGGYSANAPAFHAADGSGYAFLADQVLALDAINPQVAARIVGAFNKVGKVDAGRAAKMRAQLQRLKDTGKLSENVGEIVGRALK